MPKELQVWLREQKPKNLKEASERADDYATARKSKFTDTGWDKGGTSRGQNQAKPESEKTERPSGPGESGVENQGKLGRKNKRGCFQCGQTDHYKAQCPQIQR